MRTTSTQLLLAAALTGAFATQAVTAHADAPAKPADKTAPTKDKSSCGSKDGCNGHAKDAAPSKPADKAPDKAPPAKDKSACGGKNGCGAKGK